MIYLDHAATSFPKPTAVAAGMYAAAKACAGYGRSAHPAAIRASEIVYACRAELAALFRLPDPNAVAFTMNATMALNYAIDAAVKERAEVCISAYEHNSVVRPLVARRSRIDVVLPRPGQTTLEAWEEHIKKRPSCVIVNHVSNVFGFVQPIEEIGALCQMYQIPLIVDASQSAGVRDIDIGKIPSCAAICTAGHKGLLGPQGTGVLLVTENLPRHALITGGTGSRSAEYRQPEEVPDLFESGTHNLPGIAGLLEGVRLVRDVGPEKIRQREKELCEQLERRLSEIRGIRLIGVETERPRLAVVSIVPERMTCELLAEKLAENDICVRAGLHCAPLAHHTEGTFDSGTVRFSLGWNNTVEEVKQAADRVKTIMNTF